MTNRCCNNTCHERMPVGTIPARATLTTATGLLKYLRVTPEEPQEVVWLHDDMELQYDVESNTRWRII